MEQPKHLTIIIFLIFGLIVLWPIVFIFKNAFLVEELSFLHHLETLFLNHRQRMLIKNSISLSCGVTLLSLILGVWLAIVLEKTNLWGRSFFRLIYFIPLLIPSYIHAIIWTRLFANNNINTLNSRLASLFKIHSLPGAIFILTLAYFPFVTLITISGLKSVDLHLEEASLIHKGPWKTVKSISLPLVIPHIFSGAIFVFIFALVNFSVPDLLRVKVYPIESFIQFSAFFNDKAATLFSLPLILIAITLICIQNKYMKGRSYINLGSVKEKYNWINLSPPLNSLCFFSCGVLFALSILMPIGILLRLAGPFSNYVKSFSTSKDQIAYSILVAFLAALGSLILSFFISHAIERSLGWKRLFMELAAMLPFAVPPIVLGIGLIHIWNRPWTNFIYGSSVIIIIGYIARFLPFGIWSVQSNLKQVPVYLEEAALLHTESWRKIFWRIVAPICKPGLLVGFFIIFVLALGELSATLLIIPPGKSTVPLKIYNLMHYGAEHLVAALSLIVTGIIAILSFIFLGFSKMIMNNEQLKGINARC